MRGTVELPRRSPYGNAWLVIRVPDGRKIRSVTINGRARIGVDTAGRRIHLPKIKGRMEIVVKTL